MATAHSQLRRWAEVALTSLVAALTVWDSFPEGTAKARIIRAAVAAALAPVLIYLRHGRGSRSAPAPAERGFARLGVLPSVLFLSAFLLAMAAGCSSHSTSSGAFRSTETDQVHEQDHVTAEEQEHAAEATTAKSDEATTVKRDEAPVDVVERTFRRDGTVAREKVTHRGPVTVQVDHEKHDQVQAALETDAHKLLTEERQLEDLHGYESDGSLVTENESHPSLGCISLGWLYGLGIAVPLVYLAWRVLAKRASPL
jgi:hypothetical protein